MVHLHSSAKSTALINIKSYQALLTLADSVGLLMVWKKKILLQSPVKECTDPCNLFGWVYSGAPNTWSQQVAGVEVQKYLAGEADWDEVKKTCIDQWSKLKTTQK